MARGAKSTNIILPLGAGFIVLFAAIMGYMITKSNSSGGLSSASGGGPVTPTSIEADSPVESIRSLQATTEQMLRENEALRQRELKSIAERERVEAERLAEIERLKNELEARARSSEESNSETVDVILRQVETIKESFQNDINQLSEQLERQAGLNQERSLRADEMVSDPGYASGERIPATAGIDIVYVESLDQRAGGAASGGSLAIPGIASGLSTGRLLDVDSTGNSGEPTSGGGVVDPNVLSSIAAAINRPEPVEPVEESEPETIPYFTIPDLSVLSNGSALTALMGNVYRDGNVVNPVPIKVMVGRSNLTANFKELPPEIEGIIFGGYAVGDPTFACVKGTLTAATFVFDDGTVKSAYIGDEGDRPDNDAYPDDTIGYISDPWGNPCIPGVYTTDAVKQLSALAVLDGVAGYARALRQQEIETSIFNSDSGPVAVENLTGSASAFALATGAADGLDNASEWARETFSKIFEGYYVRAGVNVSIHVEQELRIDKEPDARLIAYTQKRRSGGRLD